MVTSRRRPLWVLLALFLAVALAACAGPGAGAGAGGASRSDTSTSDQSASEQSPESEPTPEGTDPTTPASSSSSNGNPAISVARLPVGGGSELRQDDPTLQCAEVSWIAINKAVIPRGTAVEITGVHFSPKVFEVVRSGCGTSAPNCIGYIFRSAAQSCDLLVRLVGTIPQNTSPSVGFAGLVYCPRNDSQTCREFVAALPDQQQKSVPLTVPPPPEPAPEPSPDSSPESSSNPSPESGTT
jgi:hypothetical protein